MFDPCAQESGVCTASRSGNPLDYIVIIAKGQNMTNYDVKRLALILAIQAEIEGMKALNTYRENRGETIAYDDGPFCDKAEELRMLASKHDQQL